jgi:lipoate-protein ligase A
MIVKLDHKPTGGKLLRIELEVEDGLVLRGGVRGDFFAHPEEAFEAAEAELAGTSVNRISETALALFSRPGLVLYGTSAEDIAEALGRAAHAHQAR